MRSGMDDLSWSVPAIALDADERSAQRWLHIAGQLRGDIRKLGTLKDKPAVVAAEHRADLTKAARGSCVKVEILDHSSAHSAIVSWRDPTQGMYGFQTWYRCVATRNGLCAASGAQIRPGDPVFKPRSNNGAPINAAAMIVAAFIDATPPAGEALLDD